jgi:hypothetical protein
MIVAVSESKWGGKCAHCGERIPRGGVILKVATDGETTKHGQGPGFWVGQCCSLKFKAEQPLTLFEEGEDEY